MKSRQEILEALEDAKKEAKEEIEVKQTDLEKLKERAKERGWSVPDSTEILFLAGNINSSSYIAILGNENETHFILTGKEVISNLEEFNGGIWFNRKIEIQKTKSLEEKYTSYTSTYTGGFHVAA
jgi:hypothetical protein